MSEFSHLATLILLAYRSTKRYRPDQSRQIQHSPRLINRRSVNWRLWTQCRVQPRARKVT